MVDCIPEIASATIAGSEAQPHFFPAFAQNTILSVACLSSRVHLEIPGWVIDSTPKDAKKPKRVG
jgi:hypothetical protein